jgi:hypothetical protein
MLERIDRAREDSDTSYFFDLLYFGEMVTKLCTAGLIAAVNDDRNRSRYQFLHRLVRASGIGEWTQSLDEILIGPTSQVLSSSVIPERTELTVKAGPGSWQHSAVTEMYMCLSEIEQVADQLSVKLQARQWFALFARLRNKSRGHGAVSLAAASAAAPHLRAAIDLLIANYPLFTRPWAYLYQNLSGKYRVSGIGGDQEVFQFLKSSAGQKLNLTPGVFIFFEQPSRVDLVESDVDLRDFYLANGGFSGKKIEYLSYITGSTVEIDATPFVAPPTELPKSETEGAGNLDLHGQAFSNLPTAPEGYISRLALESELRSVVLDNRHPVITLVGRGGIGKTSLALSVLHELAGGTEFLVTLWFSARDIDLLPQGPKLVKPHVLSSDDIAREFVRLMNPAEAQEKQFRPTPYFEKALSENALDGAILFVFDNFETVKNPVDLYNWLNALVRLPNKILITTRHRDFKGDYPVEVGGMTESESFQLMDATASTLGIGHLLNANYKETIYDESGGHPYVIKMLLGEVAKARQLQPVERIVASQDEILDALFERTYTMLSSAAKRVFLTLCSWRSVVPKLALEAVLLRTVTERIDAEAAVTELVQTSFVELVTGHNEGEEFLAVPLAAAVFGRSKLAVSPMKGAIEADAQLLQAFGAAQSVDIRHGLAPRIERLFKSISGRITNGEATIESYLPMLEFIARRYPPAWLLLARLQGESANEGAVEAAKSSLRRFLESATQISDRRIGWLRLIALCRRTADWPGEMHAHVELAALPSADYSDISNASSRVTTLLHQQRLVIDTDEKEIVARKMIGLMEARRSEADATDYSRLAWLYLQLQDEDSARKHTLVGMQMEPGNEHLRNLAEKLGLDYGKWELWPDL